MTRTLTLGALLVCWSAIAASAEEPAFAERGRLERGETLSQLVEATGEPLRDGVVRRVIEAPADRIRRAVTDLENYPEFFPFVATTTAAENGSWVFWVDLPWPTPDRHYRVTAVELPPSPGGPEAERVWRLSLTAEPTSERARTRWGEWTLEPWSPNRTLVTFRLRTEATSAPGPLQERATLETLPFILDGLRQHVNRCRYDQPKAATCTE